MSRLKNRGCSICYGSGRNEWLETDSSDWELKKDETAGMWSGTFTIAPGKYEYKFALNKTWDVSFSDPANNRVSGTNSVLIVLAWLTEKQMP